MLRIIDEANRLVIREIPQNGFIKEKRAWSQLTYQLKISVKSDSSFETSIALESSNHNYHKVVKTMNNYIQGSENQISSNKTRIELGDESRRKML